MDVDSPETAGQIGRLFSGWAFYYFIFRPSFVLVSQGKMMKSVFLLVYIFLLASLLGSDELGTIHETGNGSSKDQGIDGQDKSPEEQTSGSEDNSDTPSGGGEATNGTESNVPANPACVPAPSITTIDCQCGTEICNNGSMCLSGPPMTCHKALPSCPKAPNGIYELSFLTEVSTFLVKRCDA